MKWRAVKSRNVLAGLQAIGWRIKRQKGSHRILEKPNWSDFTFAFHDREEIGPKILSRIAKHTGLSPEDFIMAFYSHLPIYNTAFDLLRDLYERVPKFGKQYKYLLGGEIIKANIEAIRIIIAINNTRDNTARRELLEELIWRSESIIILLRIANELKQLGGEKSYLFLSERSVALSKQAEGWRKSVNK